MDKDTRGFCIFIGFILFLMFLACNFEIYNSNQVKIEAIKAGLVQDMCGHWVKGNK